MRGEVAIEKRRQALSGWRELADPYWEVVTLNLLANEYRRISRFPEAIECSQQSIMISRRIQNREAEATALTNLGTANSIMGRQEQAFEFFEQAPSVAKRSCGLARPDR